MREIRGFIFDNDGLLNTVEKTRNSYWPLAAEQCGYPGHSSSDFFVTLGKTSASVLEAVRALVCPALSVEAGLAEAKRIRELRNRLVDEHLANQGLDAKPGAKESLEFLADLKMPVALWTSSNGNDARRLLDMTGLRRFFSDDRIVSGDMVRHGKPSPEGALQAAERIDVPAVSCAGVDDVQVGSDALRAAGMLSIRVPDLQPLSREGISSVDATFPCLATMTAWMKSLRCDPARAALLVDRLDPVQTDDA